VKKKFLFFLLVPVVLLAQTPKNQGLQEYLIPDKGDTIRFYIYNPDSIVKTKIFLYLQGSGDLPMVNGDDAEACCYNNYPKKLMKAFPTEYAFVYIQKTGLPYYVRNINTYSPGSDFFEHDNVFDRANVANKVINYILKKIYPRAKILAVLGHSEGGDIAAKLAVMNSKVTHLCFASDNGTSQAFTDILLTRRKMRNGEISPAEAQHLLEKYNAGLDSVFKNPNSTLNYFNGNTYKWQSTFNQPPIDNLLKLTIPVLLTIGSNDEKVPIETADFIVSEFIRHQKNNLTYKVYLNSNHSYMETLSDGKKVDHWTELFMDFLTFVSQNSR
jgi:esterase/lipase